MKCKCMDCVLSNDKTPSSIPVRNEKHSADCVCNTCHADNELANALEQAINRASVVPDVPADDYEEYDEY